MFVVGLGLWQVCEEMAKGFLVGNSVKVLCGLLYDV